MRRFGSGMFTAASMSKERWKASSWLTPSWIMGTSVSWAAMVRLGLSAAMGS